MTHTYTITGMSCNGCRTKAEKALNELDGVEAVVTLDPPTAAIASEKPVPVFKLQKALYSAGNYIISESVKAISKGTYKHREKHINPFGDKMEEPELLILNAMHKRDLSILENQRRKEHIRNVSKPLSYE